MADTEETPRWIPVTPFKTTDNRNYYPKWIFKHGYKESRDNHYVKLIHIMSNRGVLRSLCRYETF